MSFSHLPDTPLLVPGVGVFSNVNIFAFDQYKAKFKTDLKSLSPISIK